MTAIMHHAPLLDFHPDTESFLDDVLHGLSLAPKTLPCKYFYDEEGSRLFDEICGLEEYYPTRTETALMEAHAGEMATLLGRDVVLVEYGSGSSTKSRILLDNLPDLEAYVPIDISREHLCRSADCLACEYAGLPVHPVCADYTAPFRLPTFGRGNARWSVYFPGSTIGNFHRPEAVRFLRQIARVVGPGGALLIGVDLRKDTQVLEAAYNDRRGVTAAFNMNLLRRINRELGADFNLDRFRHHAFYNEDRGRIEMHLQSLANQTVRIDRDDVSFSEGETIFTECSYKYSLEGFAGLAAEAGFTVRRVWTDAARLFSVQYLVATKVDQPPERPYQHGGVT
ncbi:MAG TPA: L-histidine N(alpha)-methyltransferase [Armatimonadota bacterium]|jgi:dimethylhistidine N-methyltransferase